MKTLSQMYKGLWRVERHSGRNNSAWRVLWSGTSESEARDRYDVEFKKMRQGGVTLVRPDGKTEFVQWAPRLRTRW